MGELETLDQGRSRGRKSFPTVPSLLMAEDEDMAVNDLTLGATLRAWRNRTSPAAVGLTAGRSRRAPGLRREELADLVGMSVDYVVRLEQGRVTTPSAAIVAGLARALQLDRKERDHLYRIAGLQPPGDRMVTDHIPPGMQRVLVRLGETPAAVFAADWQLVWWNRSWTALFGDPRMLAPEGRNLVRSRFLTSRDEGKIAAWPVVLADAEASDRAIVSDLRRASGRYPADRRITSLIAQMIEKSHDFARLWQEGAVGGHIEDRKTIQRHGIGPITLDCDVLTDTDTDLKVVIYTAAPGTSDETKLRLSLLAGNATPAPADS